jgi:probable rRNA maturation factor
MIQVRIANQQNAWSPDFDRIRLVARTVLDGEKVASAKVTIALVDNATIHRLNKQFLDHDEPTDVLAFPYSSPKSRILEGELAIGVEVAQAQAQERGHDISCEISLYLIHGLLHLCGYDDHDDDDLLAMRDRERHYLRRLQLPDIAGE